VLSVDEARHAVLARIARLPAERVPLDEACGRVLAEDVVAARALPGFDASAMDGYAARAAELPGALSIAAHVAAGAPLATAVPARAAVRILTGAPLPAALDTIVIQEDARIDGDLVHLPASAPGANIRRTGEDVAPGERAIAAGTRLGAGELGLLAALGVAHVPVARAPRVAIIATGDELVDVVTAPGPGQLVDSSAHALLAQIAEAGGRATYLGIARDDRDAIAHMIEHSLDYDAVVTTGGVSVGDRDHVRDALAAAGVALELWKVAMKPGKPFAFGTTGTAGRAAVFGLPGNPVSTFVAFELFVRPALLALQGAAQLARPRAPVALAGGYAKPPGRAHYLRARVVRDGARLVAHPHAKQGSAMLSSLVGCNALVEVRAEVTAFGPDAPVDALLLEAV
jgi:molybdopterin molybdotransferase